MLDASILKLFIENSRNTKMMILQKAFLVGGLDSWIREQLEVCNASIAMNFMDSGAIIASPSQHDPDYYYHWVRDAAITTMYTRYISQNQDLFNIKVVFSS